MNDTPPIMITDIRRIRLRRIKAGSLFKLVFIANATVFVPLVLLCGIAALFGAETIRLGDKPVTGIGGLLAALVLAPVFTAIFSLFAWFGAYIGIRVWGYFKPIEVEYVPADI